MYDFREQHNVLVPQDPILPVRWDAINRTHKASTGLTSIAAGTQMVEWGLTRCRKSSNIVTRAQSCDILWYFMVPCDILFHLVIPCGTCTLQYPVISGDRSLSDTMWYLGKLHNILIRCEPLWYLVASRDLGAGREAYGADLKGKETNNVNH